MQVCLKIKASAPGEEGGGRGGGERGETGLCKHHMSTACKFINSIKNEMMRITLITFV